MLHVYSYEQASILGLECVSDVEDAFLDIKLSGSELERKILRKIEGASFYSSSFFLDRFSAKLPVSDLSTGCKAALVVASRPDLLVDTKECGFNARDTIVTDISDGNIIVEWGDVTIRADNDCRICCSYDGIDFSTVYDLNWYIMHGMVRG